MVISFAFSMGNSAFLAFLFLLLISKNVMSFTFQHCTKYEYYDTENIQCSDEIYEEDNFNIETINPLGTKILISLNPQNNEETINFDDFPSRIQFYFKNTGQTKLIIETNDWNPNYYGEETKAEIYANDIDVIINNINESVPENLFVFNEFSFKTIKSKDSSKTVHLVETYYDNSIVIKEGSILDSKIYLNKASIRLPDELQNSFTIILKPSQILRYSEIKEECKINFNYVPQNVNIIYGKNQIKIEYENKETVTILTTTLRTDVDLYISNACTITCEDGLSDLDIIVPHIDADSTNYPSIKGNWPIIRKTKLESEILNNGYKLTSFYREPVLDGVFYYEAKSFTVDSITKRRGMLNLILTEKESSLYCISPEIYYNFSISTINDDIERYFYLEGKSLETYYRLRHYSDGEVSEEYSCIITESPKLTIIANTRRDIRIAGPAKLMYKKIDNSWREVKDTLKFAKGGTIVLPFGFDYEECYNNILDIYDQYEEANPLPEDHTFSDNANHLIKFAKEKIADLSSIINDAANNISPITVSLTDAPKSDGKKNNIVLNRKDFPFSSLYLNFLNKLTSAVCVDSGTIDISQWSFVDAANIIEPFIDEDEDENIIEYYSSRFIPTFKYSAIKGKLESTENNKCVGFQLENTPSSAFEIFVYTTNTTYIEILEKIELITVLNSDLDAAFKLKNPNTKSIFIIVLDDLPEGKSINLKGIRIDCNVFLVGFDESKIDNIYQVIQTYNDLYDQYDYNPPDGEYDYTEYDRLKEERKRKQIELISNVFKQYTQYLPKASINFDKIESLILVSVNYVGTHINCTNFYTIASTFSNINGLSKDFDADVTITETVTYKQISSLQLNDLVLFAVSNNPINVMSIDEVSFYEGSWNLLLKAFIGEDGFIDTETANLRIDANKIGGKLYLYSAGSKCNLVVPDEKKDQKLKGISIKLNFYNEKSIRVNEIPGIIMFDDDQENVQKKSRNKQIIHNIANTIYSFINKKQTIKDKNTLIAPKEEEEEESGSKSINFVGNWLNVKEIDSLEIDTGNDPAVIESIPPIVLKVINVKSEGSINLGTEAKKVEFSQPQVVSKPKSISFNDDKIDVSFSDITFTGSNPKLSLLLGGKTSKIITKNLTVESGTVATIDGELSVSEALEFGPDSSLIATSVSSTSPSVKFNYRLSGRIPEIPDGIEPKSIVFNYAGESVGTTNVVDYSEYSGVTNNKLTLTGNDHKNKCEKLKDSATLTSDFYKEFRKKGDVVDFECIENGDSTIFALKVVKVASGEKETPEPFEPTANIGTPTPEPDNNKKGLKAGEIAGIVIGCIAFVAIVAVLVWYFVFHRRRDDGSQNSVDENVDE